MSRSQHSLSDHHLLAALHLAAEAPALSAPDADGPRRFSGVAYSGAPLQYFGQRMVVDLADVTLPTPCPVLESHDRALRRGVAALASDGERLRIDGRLLANEGAQQIAADADAGFPWQLSIHAEPGSVEELGPGAEATINGRTLSGPLTILRQVRIRETSFTPTGVDAETSARVFSVPAHPPEDHPMSEHPRPEAASPGAEEARITQLEQQLAEQTARAEAAEAQLAAAPGAEVVADLQRQVAELTARIETGEREDLILGAEADGRLLPGSALHQHAESLGLEPLKALLASLTPVAALQGSQTGGRAPAAAPTPEWSPQLEAEFGSREVYDAYRAAEQKGLIKIYGGDA